MKPLFRWTLGPCISQGIDILIESVRKTTEVLGISNFDWMICYNQLDRSVLTFLKQSLQNYPVHFYLQDWQTCPIIDNENWHNPQRRDGTFGWDGNQIGGTLWKICPPRMRMETIEIVMDNDIVILKEIGSIKQFLNQKSYNLVLKEPIRFYGRYDKFMSLGSCYNSGLMGFVPGYDFGKEIYRMWQWYGSLKNLSQADEQGLLMLTLTQKPYLSISEKDIVEVLARDFNYEVTDGLPAIHFTQSNRIPNHRGWKGYLKLKDGDNSLKFNKEW